MRRAAKVDLNHTEIVTALRKLGWSVLSLAAVGKGVPDLLCHRAGVLRLCEVKGPKGKLTEDQEVFHKLWPVVILRSVDDAENLK